LETFIEARAFVDDPQFADNRRAMLGSLGGAVIDPPMVDIVKAVNRFPHAFTLQSCCGHFVCHPGQDAHNRDRLPDTAVGAVTYRIAYLALCIENSSNGRALFGALEALAASDSAMVQFGSATWFWDQYRNSYALQVEPVRFQDKDQVAVAAAEARRIEAARDAFLMELTHTLEAHRLAVGGFGP
jgi:hypothetical protein